MKFDQQKLKRVARFAYGKSLVKEAEEEGQFPAFGSNGQFDLHSQTNLIPPAIIIGRKGSYGKLTWVDQPAFATDTTFFVDRRYTKTNLRWLFYVLSTLELDTGTEEAAVPGLSREKAYEKYVPYVDPSHQTAIADFLDRETARIDGLIAQEERLLALLEEKRTALISHGVTKGLDPNAELKDSGIEWLGQIPKDWELRPLKYGFRFRKGPNAQLLTSTYIGENEGDYPVYSGQTENGGVMGKIDTYVFDLPEVIFTTTVGAKVMTSQVVKDKFSLSQNCVIMIPSPLKANARFFSWQLETLFDYEKASIPSHMQPSLRISDLKSYKVAYPPIGEMNSIVEYLLRRTARFDTLKTKITRAIELLREKRTALISAAVTGKIDLKEGTKL